jgi:pyochelin biosynthesis protein PchC
VTGTYVTAAQYVRRYEPAPDAALRLVCLPHAGGSASFFFNVAKALAPAVQVLAIQYPGRQERRAEPLITSIDVLADQIVEALRGSADRPLALFGHSMGALLAYEVATRLEAFGVVPAAVFVSGRRAPSLPSAEMVAHGSDSDMMAELRSLSGTAGSLLDDDEVVKMIMPVLRADYAAVAGYQYRPRPGLAAPIAAFTGESDPRVTVEEARAWSAHTVSSFVLRTFPGGHFYLSEHPERVVTAIRALLGVSQAGTTA